MKNILKYDIVYEGAISSFSYKFSSEKKCSTCKEMFEDSTLEKVEYRNIFFTKKTLFLCKSCLRERKLKKLGV